MSACYALILSLCVFLQNQVLSQFSDTIRGTLTKIQRLKFVSLVTIGIHARDVVDKMYKSSK